jgi:hypothetical protein
MASEEKSLGNRVEEYNCPHATIAHLSREQIRGLHGFKGAFARAFAELYEVLPAEAADKIIGPLLKGLSE